jgi:LAO/AO transport system kinase
VTVVVLVPGLGDEVQALKAGIMEIADVFAVNKADRDGADRLVAEIQAMLSLGTHEGRLPAIVKTVATGGQGIDDLLEAVEDFRARAESSGLLAQKRRALLARQLEEILQDRLLRRVRARVLTPEERERIVDRMAAREVDPFSAADRVLERMGL